MSVATAFPFGRRATTALDVDAAARHVREALAARDFEIVLDAELDGERLIGVIHPALLREARQFEERIALLLPWTVTVAERDGTTEVAVLDVRERLRATNNGLLAALAARADTAFEALLAELPE